MWFGIFKHSFSFSVYGKIYHRLAFPPCNQIEAKINAISTCGVPPELWQDVDHSNCAQECHSSTFSSLGTSFSLIESPRSSESPSSSESESLSEQPSSSKSRSPSKVHKFQHVQLSGEPDSSQSSISVPSSLAASANRKRRKVKRTRTVKVPYPRSQPWVGSSISPH